MSPMTTERSMTVYRGNTSCQEDLAPHMHVSGSDWTIPPASIVPITAVSFAYHDPANGIFDVVRHIVTPPVGRPDVL